MAELFAGTWDFRKIGYKIVDRCRSAGSRAHGGALITIRTRSLGAQAAFPSGELHPQGEARAHHCAAGKIRERRSADSSGSKFRPKSTIHALSI